MPGLYKQIDEKTKNYILELLKQIENEPECREAYVRLAAILVKYNKTDHAIKFYQRANDIKEDYISLYNLGSLFYRKGQFKKAIILLEKSKILKKNFIMAPLVIGLCYSRLNNIKAATSNFINVLMIEPSNKTALIALSMIYHNNGKTADSKQLIKRLTDIYPEDEKIVKIKSDILYFSGETRESAQVIKEIKKSSKKFNIYDEYIKSVPVEFYNDRFGSLKDKLNKLEAGAKTCKTDLIKLSLVHLFSGNTDSAIDYLFEARSKNEIIATSSV